jgi:hypothetical protein
VLEDDEDSDDCMIVDDDNPALIIEDDDPAPTSSKSIPLIEENRASKETIKFTKLVEEEQFFYCKYCQSFQSERNDLLTHIKKKHSFQCDECSFWCGRVTELESHIIRAHEKRENHQCNICGLKGFLNTTIIDLHKEIGHNINHFPCRFCSENYDGAESLRIHVAFQHSYASRAEFKKQNPSPHPNIIAKKIVLLPQIKSVADKITTFTTKKLSEKAPSATLTEDPLTLITKIKMEPLEVPQEELKVVAIKLEEIVKTENGESVEEKDIEAILNESVVVEENNDLMKEIEDVLMEELPEITEQPIAIEIQDKRIISNWRGSKATLKEGPVKCLDCQKYMDVEELLLHRLNEHSDGTENLKIFPPMPPELLPRKIKRPPKEYFSTCSYCFEEMPRNRFVTHLNQFHANELKPFLCDVCSKDFFYEWQLKNHMRLHDPDLMYNCDLCGVKYLRKYKIQHHILRQHLHKMIYKGQCKICLQKTMKSLKKHMKKYHEKGYDCGARVNSETNWFDCYKCGATYVDLYTYRRHDCEKGRFQIRCEDCMRPVKNMENLKTHKANKCFRTNNYGFMYKY